MTGFPEQPWGGGQIVGNGGALDGFQKTLQHPRRSKMHGNFLGNPHIGTNGPQLLNKRRSVQVKMRNHVMTWEVASVTSFVRSFVHSFIHQLVVSIPLKHISQNGNLPQVVIKIKNV